MKSIIFVLIMFVSTNCLAQNKNIEEVLHKINTSEFMLQFDSIKNEIEFEAKNLKKANEQIDFTSDEIKQLRSAYNGTVKRLNNILESMKFDLMDKKRRKQLIKNADEFNKRYVAEMESACAYFKNGFYKEKIEVLANHDIDAIGIPIAITTVKSVLDIVKYLKSYKSDLKKLTTKQIESKLISPNKIKSWDIL